MFDGRIKGAVGDSDGPCCVLFNKSVRPSVLGRGKRNLTQSGGNSVLWEPQFEISDSSSTYILDWREMSMFEVTEISAKNRPGIS
jgi:hypothetical protein